MSDRNSSEAQHKFSDELRRGVYEAIFTRRDVRGQFKPDPVSDEVLSRVITAAHYAPSVGFMQPWSFVVVKDQEVKRSVHDLFSKAHLEAAQMFEGEKRDIYSSLKLEGVLESPVNICITCDRDRAGPVVVGRTHIPEMDLYSSVCAVQNLWLAARAEGLGVGWVSILDNAGLQKALDIPEKIIPVAYLCIGYVSEFFDKPELEAAGWRPRLKIDDVLHFDQWDNSGDKSSATLVEQLKKDQELAQKGSFHRELS
jgi:5,6-dimethylbenzimidazole synthase